MLGNREPSVQVVIVGAEVGRQGFPGQLLLVAGVQERIGGIEPLQLQGAEFGQGDHGDARLLLGDGVQRVGRLLVAQAHVQRALGAGQAEIAGRGLFRDAAQAVVELLARRFQPLAFDRLLPTVGIVTQQGLLVSDGKGQRDDVPRPVGSVAAEIFAPDGLALHIGVTAPVQDLLAQLKLRGGGETVVVAQVHVVARRIADQALVVGRDGELQLRLAAGRP